MTEHATVPDAAPTADGYEDTTGPVDRDDLDDDLPADALERCPLFDVDVPGGCG